MKEEAKEEELQLQFSSSDASLVCSAKIFRPDPGLNQDGFFDSSTLHK